MTWGKTLNESVQEPCYRAAFFYIISKTSLLSEKHKQGSAQPLFWEVSSSPDLDACSLFWNTAALFLMVRLWLFWARKIFCGYEVLNWRNGKLSQMHALRDGPLMQRLPLQEGGAQAASLAVTLAWFYFGWDDWCVVAAGLSAHVSWDPFGLNLAS